MHVLRNLDPKLLSTAATALVGALLLRLGFDLDDPLTVALAPLAAACVVGWLTPNAASGQLDRWTGDEPEPEPDLIDLGVDDLDPATAPDPLVGIDVDRLE
jgi:hypothetical protein